MLEVGEVVGQRLDDGRVQRAVHAVVGGAQVLGTWREIQSQNKSGIAKMTQISYSFLSQLYVHNHSTFHKVVGVVGSVGTRCTGIV